jgi:hypothetical protein
MQKLLCIRAFSNGENKIRGCGNEVAFHSVKA